AARTCARRTEAREGGEWSERLSVRLLGRRRRGRRVSASDTRCAGPWQTPSQGGGASRSDSRDDEADQETRGDQQQKEGEADLELALGQPVGETGAEGRDPARERCNEDDAEHGDEPERQRRQEGPVRQAGQDITDGAGERDGDAEAGGSR